jgi:hypothetical protein
MNDEKLIDELMERDAERMLEESRSAWLDGHYSPSASRLKYLDDLGSSKTFFVVWNLDYILDNHLIPELDDLTESEMVDWCLDRWCLKKNTKTRELASTRSAAANFEVGDNRGNRHIHMELIARPNISASAVDEAFPGCFLEETASLDKALQYIRKEGPYAYKAHTVVVPARFRGRILEEKLDAERRMNEAACAPGEHLSPSPSPGPSGSSLESILYDRKLDKYKAIDMAIRAGYTPEQIMATGGSRFAAVEGTIKKAFDVRIREIATKPRDVRLVWHTGNPGSGKTETPGLECEKAGRSYYLISAGQAKSPWDFYAYEDVIHIDEFREENWDFSTLLSVTDRRVHPYHARYTDKYGIWSEVHVSTVIPPEFCYMDDGSRRVEDVQRQLFRRISEVDYHYEVPCYDEDDPRRYRYVSMEGKEYFRRGSDRIEGLKRQAFEVVERECGERGYDWRSDPDYYPIDVKLDDEDIPW